MVVLLAAPSKAPSKAAARQQHGSRARLTANVRRPMLACASLASDASLEEAANLYFPGRTFTFASTSGGVNNVVVYLNVNEQPGLAAERHILRVYNNGENTARVRYEHAVLLELSAVTASSPLSFKVPVPARAPNGGTFVTLRSGAEAALFELVPGRLPKMTCTRAIGRASGELTAAMGRVTVPFPSPTAPYWDVYAVHRSVTRDNFHQTVASSAFAGVREPTDFLVDSLHVVEASIERLRALQLPEQLIHGDLHYDNLLVDDSGTPTILLDVSLPGWLRSAEAGCADASVAAV
jgi:Ser/Thr protein kinase RdoA (MazF antagonist)